MIARGIFFIDLDGTLVGEHGIHDRVWAPLDALRSAGIRLAVCTGRPGRGVAMDIARRLDPEGLHVFESGGAVMKTTGELVADHPLAGSAVADIAAFAATHACTLEAYAADGRYLVPARDDLVRAHEDLLGFEAELAEPWPPTLPLVRLQLVTPTPRWPELERLAAPTLAPVSSHEGRSPRVPGVSFISITAPSISKATGMRAVLEALGLPPALAAMAGDNHNDLDALRLAGTAFVPDDGRPEAQALAHHLIPSPTLGGIADAAAVLLDRFR